MVGKYGFESIRVPWQVAVVDVNKPHGIFVDQFLGWVFNSWGTTGGELTDRGRARKEWMEERTSRWLSIN